MAGVPAKRGEAFNWETELTSQADTNVFQVNPTLAAGDVIVYQDGVLDGNIDILPTAIGGSATIACQLSAAEMTADRIKVRFHDAVGAEWQDQSWEFFTVDTPSDELIGAIWDEVLTGATHNIPASAGRRIRELGAMSIISGTVVAAAAQSVTLDIDASAEAGIYTPNLIVITEGTGAGQTRMILEYSAVKVAIVDRPWTVIPEAGVSEYQLIAFNSILLASHGIALSGTASTITVPGIVPVDVGCVIFIAGGTGSGETRLISEVTIGVGSTVIGVTPDWTTIPDATTIYKILPVGLSIVASVNTDAINAAALATDAVTEIQAGLGTSANQTTILARIGAFTGTGVNNILGILRAIMRSDTSTPSDVGGTYDDATDSLQAIRDVLQSTTVNVTAVVDGDVVTVTRGDTLVADIDGLGDISNYEKLWFTVKRDRNDADSASILQVLLTSPTVATDGLQYLNAAAATASQGSIAVDDASAGDITVTVDEAATAQLAGQACVYDIQVLRTTGAVSTLTWGECDIDADVTRATS